MSFDLIMKIRENQKEAPLDINSEKARKILKAFADNYDIPQAKVVKAELERTK